jgi:hypothetical protein
LDELLNAPRIALHCLSMGHLVLKKLTLVGHSLYIPQLLLVLADFLCTGLQATCGLRQISPFAGKR